MGRIVPSERVVIVGAGVAGLATALALEGLPVTVLAPARVGEQASTAWAQGGIAAAMGGDDNIRLHAADTLAAAAGMARAEVAGRVAAAAPECILALARLGVPFDRDASGGLALGLEAAHSRRRIVHAGGDATGRELLATLGRRARERAEIELIEDATVTRLRVSGERVSGVHAVRGGRAMLVPARAVVLATGGAGGLYLHTTNPLASFGAGLALAARAGAALRDVEFVQFHPTAIDAGIDPMPLASEAIRGEGAVLVNSAGERFMADVPGRELAPRDVVARAIWRELQCGRRVFLDAREALGRRFETRFPSVSALCRQAGIDPATQPIPVRPAAHYHMGGIAVDQRGRASVPGLWACGEVAATGLHGANRLASNSLIEALAYARWIAEDIRGSAAPGNGAALEEAAGASEAVRGLDADITPVRRVMSAAAGVIREARALSAAAQALARWAFDAGAGRRLADAALAGLFIVTGALRREESRGAQCRADHPLADPRQARSIEISLAEVREAGMRAAPRRASA